MRTRRFLLIPAVALVAGLTACGDDGPTAEGYRAEADGFCSAGNIAISSAAKPTNAPQVATSAGTVVTTIDAQTAMLWAKKTPGGDDDAQIGGVVSTIAEVSAPAKALQDAAAKNDDAAMAKAGVELQSRADAAATSAQAYGLTQCGAALKPAVANLYEGTKSVVKSSYVTKSAALCRDAMSRTEAVSPPGKTLASTSRYLDAVVAISVTLVGDLKAIPVPPGDEATVNELMVAIEALNAKGQEVSAAAKSNNPNLVLALVEEIAVANTALNAKLDAYGLDACGTGSG